MKLHTLRDLSKTRLERLLCDWANIDFPWPMVNFTQEQLKRFAAAQNRMQRRWQDLDKGTGLIGHLWVRDFLRAAWSSADLREKEWFCFRARDALNKMNRRREMTPEERRQDELSELRVDSLANRLPPFSDIEAAFHHFLRNARRARRCRNRECPAPFFFAARRNQKYCSVSCSRPAELAGKRYWARKHRAKLRKKGTKHRAKTRGKKER
jgi:hypothetical protein